METWKKFRADALSFIRAKHITDPARKIGFLFAEGLVIALVLTLLTGGWFSFGGILPFALGFRLAWHIRSRLG